ncbi:MAG: fimbria/pilus outer membrane usher protein [Xanthobacteraceae bacterium]
MLFVCQDGARADNGSRQFQLEVIINDTPAQIIGTFTRLADGRFAATRAELGELGIKPPGERGPDDLVVIDDMPGASYRYDEPEQKIYLTLGDEQRITKIYDARGTREAPNAIRNDYGAVMNYWLFASSANRLSLNSFTFSGANASLDTRVFSPLGTLSQTGIVGSTVFKNFEVLRLDTTWSYSDPDNVVTYRAGDTISGGLAWTRPIRLGGAQMQRNFALRPDLVTLPMPSVSGSAAVPSTVDVYVNNLKTYSQAVGTGPYAISNLPLSGGGTARIVVQDSSGRPVETSLPFYSSPRLLRDGLMDFSVEAGFPRLFYGTESFSYVRDPVASASARRGLFDWLTLEGHGEGSAGLMNGGLGAVVGVGPWGVLSLAGTASRFNNVSGFQSYVAFDTQLLGINIHASSQRTYRAYNDLASVTSRAPPLLSLFSDRATDIPSSDLFSVGYFPPKFLDTVSMSFPLPFAQGSVSAGLMHLGAADGKVSDLFTLSYARALPWDASFYISAFGDLRDKKTGGIFAGISIPLGKSTFASTGFTQTRQGTNFTADAGKSIESEVGSYGWRVHDSEGTSTDRGAMGTYRASIAEVQGNVWQRPGSAGGSLQASGAVATMGGGVFLANRIDDSFAVVDTGTPGVDVLYENRPAGKTNSRGQVLIPTLRSYQANKIAIDPAGLPINADISETQLIVTPADRTGVLARFGVKTDVKSAVVVLSDKGGKVLPAGTAGRLEGTEETFIVGYDGRAYVKGLGEANTVLVSSPAGECRASFPFTAQQDSQVVIGPVVCQ